MKPSASFQSRGSIPATRFFLFSLFLLSLLAPAHATDEATLWQALRSGEAFAIMRHELAPGTGDPDNFEIGDCATQRNLNDTGRKRARTTGRRFTDNGIEAAEIHTSAWCRCRETAELLGLGPFKDLPALNSFYENYAAREPQTAQLKRWLANRQPGRPLVLVSHQVNIHALTGEPTSSGQIVVARIAANGEIEVLGKL